LLFKTSVHTLELSIFIPPVPHLSTFSATVFSLKGLRATVTGSSAGLRDVHRHSRSEVHLSTTTHSFGFNHQVPLSFGILPCHFLIPITSLSLPSNLSIAFQILSDFGNQLFQVRNTFQFLLATKHQVGTSTHQTYQSYSISVIVAKVVVYFFNVHNSCVLNLF
jgi:hypothetical protein